MTSAHYYEVHVTTDPIATDQAERFAAAVQAHGFRPAKLLMQKGPDLRPSNLDAFCTLRTGELLVALRGTAAVVRALDAAGFKVRRYKVESTLVDSREIDEFRLLS